MVSVQISRYLQKAGQLAHVGFKLIFPTMYFFWYIVVNTQLIVALFSMHDAKAESSLLMSPGKAGEGTQTKEVSQATSKNPVQTEWEGVTD